MNSSMDLQGPSMDAGNTSEGTLTDGPAVPFRNDQFSVMSQDDVIELLRDPPAELICSTPPVLPREGCVFVFDTRPLVVEYGLGYQKRLNERHRRGIARCDQYRWTSKGCRLLKSQLYRNYYWIDHPGKPRTGDQQFTKVDFWLKDDERFMVTHYIGNAERAIAFPHRNSTKNVSNGYCSTKPLLRLLTATKVRSPTPPSSAPATKSARLGVRKSNILSANSAFRAPEGVSAQNSKDNPPDKSLNTTTSTTTIIDDGTDYPYEYETLGSGDQHNNNDNVDQSADVGNNTNNSLPPLDVRYSQMSNSQLQRYILQRKAQVLDLQLNQHQQITSTLQQADTLMLRFEKVVERMDTQQATEFITL